MAKAKVATNRKRASDMLSDDKLREAINEKNSKVFPDLERQLRSALGLIPFVGAGMSAGIKLGEGGRFRPWGDLLNGLALGTPVERGVAKLVKAGKYEEAATAVVGEIRSQPLHNAIRREFDREFPDAEVLQGAISYIPFLTNGPVVTTNFDRVLERAFDLARRPFAECVSGPMSNLIVEAIHENKRSLIKIHGDCREAKHRVLTTAEYDEAYGSLSGNKKRTEDIGSLSWLIYTNRPILFLGSSLETDRTVQVLQAIKKRLPTLRHYAVMAAVSSKRDWRDRERHLDKLGVSCLWYFPEHFDEIGSILRELLERASTRQLNVAKANPPRAERAYAQTNSFGSGDPALDSDFQRFSVDLDLITNALRHGKLAFFLGAGAGLDSGLSGKQFYEWLERKYGVSQLPGDRTAIASLVRRRHGQRQLMQDAHPILKEYEPKPSTVHRFVAAIPAMFRKKGVRLPPLCILTTNYDTCMEEALADAKEKFELLYYVNEVSPYYGAGLIDADEVGRGGGFIERSPKGDARLLEKPGNLRARRTDTHLVVKLNGGLDYYNNLLLEQISVDRAAFERIASSIPAILPAFLRSELQERSLLFLGHGLAEPDVHRLIEFGSELRKDGNERPLWAWAVKRLPEMEADKDWPRWGLKVIHEELSSFTMALGAKIP